MAVRKLKYVRVEVGRKGDEGDEGDEVKRSWEHEDNEGRRR